MDISLIKEINSSSENISLGEIVTLGDIFSGSIYYDDTRRSWVQFNLVNKEKMDYILNDINDNPGVSFEIQVYVNNPEKVQR